MKFKIAFGVEDYYSGLALDDPDFVRWDVQLNTLKFNETIKEKLKFHKCTDHDFD